MARIRSIKPDFNTREDIARLSRDSQLFLIKLQPECDDYGRIHWLPKKIAGDLYPHATDIGPDEVQAWASELAQNGFFMLYEVQGSVYGCIIEWESFQRVDNPGKAVIPEPTDEQIVAFSRDPSETLARLNPLDMGYGNKDIGSRIKEVGGGKEECTADAAPPLDVITPEIVLEEPEQPEGNAEVPEVIDDVSEVIIHFNQVCEKTYHHDMDSSRTPIKKLMEEYDATVEQLKLVAEYQYFEWNGTSQQKYIRPETVYRKCHWENYLQEAEAWNNRGRVPLKPNGKHHETMAEQSARLDAEYNVSQAVQH